MSADPRFEAALTPLELGALRAYLPVQRWFADKGAAVREVRLLDAAPVAPVPDGAQTYDAIFSLPELDRSYVVPLAIGGAPQDSIASTSDGVPIADAMGSDAFILGVLADVRSARRTVGLRGGTFAAQPTAALHQLPPAAAPTVRRSAVEQTNSSVFIGGAIVLKAYRRSHFGAQPELEVARFLDAVGFRNTPALLGFVEYERDGRDAMAVWIAQRFVENDGDAWTWTLAYLHASLRRADARSEPAASTAHEMYVAWARRLGVRTAELHRAFATPTEMPGFAPEAVGPDDLARWTARARETASDALDRLARDRDRVPEALRQKADALLVHRPATLDALAAPALERDGLVQTRYHGDFHLGQVLVVGDDAMIVDFEGEPGRDVAARRALSSPLRDVAGMLRSFDYAAVAAVNALCDEGANRDLLEPLAQEWERRAARAFLEGYRDAIAGCASYPRDPAKAQALLDLFTVEKAFYEMSYELANRPAWLRIPIAGINSILGRAIRG
ncbi:MAG: putative maltokinase [Candidatus Eremiobacteraeota bacterium]|nr:putative maltokinase [Candidatus Eremiobacteraeota bacterium]